MYNFEYQRATSIEDALKKHGDAEDARFLAGGMTLIPVLKQRLDQPSDIIDLAELSDITGIFQDGDSIIIKAMTTHHTVHSSKLVTDKIPAQLAVH